MKKQDKLKLKAYYDTYQEVQILSKSQQQSVVLVKNIYSQYFISKKYNLKTIQPSQKQSIINQINISKSLKHPNIIKIIQIFQGKQQLYCIQQYCQEGDLAHYIKCKIKKKQYFTQQIINSWLIQILNALQFIHNLKIIHRDIKTSNIFLTTNGNIKIGSFGISKSLKNKNFAITVTGTPVYMSPQMIQNNKYDFKTDIWSLGCLIYELCTFKRAFDSNNIIQLATKIMKSQIQDIPSERYTKQLNLIIKKCLKKNPSERPSARQLLKLPYCISIIQKFIKNNGIISQNQQKIPIKKFKIHQKIQKKIFKKVIKKISDIQPAEVKSEKIQRKQSRQIIKKVIKPPVLLSKLPDRKSSQNFKNLSKDKKQSIDKKDKVVQQKNQKKQVKLPNLPKQKKLIPPKSASSRESQSSNSKINQQNSGRFSYEQQQSSQQKKQTNWIDNEQIDYNLTLTNQNLATKLLSFKKSRQSKSNSHEINQGQKGIFESLIVRQDAQDGRLDENNNEIVGNNENRQQLDKNRLTISGNEIPQLLNQFKNKFEQIAKQLNIKYGPDMQTIQQKTNQFDSNQFAKINRQQIKEQN